MSFGLYVSALSSLRYEILFRTVLSVIRFPYTSLSCTRSAKVLTRDSISVDEECLSGINYSRLRENNFTFSGSLQSDEIFSEFHGYSQKMMKWIEMLIKTARKMRKKTEISGICAKFHSFISFFQSYPYS